MCSVVFEFKKVYLVMLFTFSEAVALKSMRFVVFFYFFVFCFVFVYGKKKKKLRSLYPGTRPEEEE